MYLLIVHGSQVCGRCGSGSHPRIQARQGPPTRRRKADTNTRHVPESGLFLHSGAQAGRIVSSWIRSHKQKTHCYASGIAPFPVGMTLGWAAANMAHKRQKTKCPIIWRSSSTVFIFRLLDIDCNYCNSSIDTNRYQYSQHNLQGKHHL
jgi:uncharacterized membrane protein YsdA (DUF1294 family)